jgi:hypothetical protein
MDEEAVWAGGVKYSSFNVPLLWAITFELSQKKTLLLLHVLL